MIWKETIVILNITKLKTDIKPFNKHFKFIINSKIGVSF